MRSPVWTSPPVPAAATVSASNPKANLDNVACLQQSYRRIDRGSPSRGSMARSNQVAFLVTASTPAVTCNTYPCDPIKSNSPTNEGRPPGSESWCPPNRCRPTESSVRRANHPRAIRFGSRELVQSLPMHAQPRRCRVGELLWEPCSSHRIQMDRDRDAVAGKFPEISGIEDDRLCLLSTIFLGKASSKIKGYERCWIGKLKIVLLKRG